MTKKSIPLKKAKNVRARAQEHVERAQSKQLVKLSSTKQHRDVHAGKDYVSECDTKLSFAEEMRALTEANRDTVSKDDVVNSFYSYVKDRVREHAGSGKCALAIDFDDVCELDDDPGVNWALEDLSPKQIDELASALRSQDKLLVQIHDNGQRLSVRW